MCVVIEVTGRETEWLRAGSECRRRAECPVSDSGAAEAQEHPYGAGNAPVARIAACHGYVEDPVSVEIARRGTVGIGPGRIDDLVMEQRSR